MSTARRLMWNYWQNIMCAEFTLPLYDFATMPKCFNTARKINEWKKKKSMTICSSLPFRKKHTILFFAGTDYQYNYSLQQRVLN